jgi:transcriptional regulator with XRE-family HTH domain
MREPASRRFRKRLRELREACRWTQKRAAKACRIGHRLYQLYELGIKKNPGLLMLEKLSRGFGLEVHELLAPAPSRIRKRPATQYNKRKRRRQKPGRKKQ